MEAGGGGLEGAVERPEGQVGEFGGGEQVDVDIAETRDHPLPSHPAPAGTLQLLLRACSIGKKSGGNLLSPDLIDGVIGLIEAGEEAVDKGGSFYRRQFQGFLEQVF